jgi:hypothetical protein
MADWKQKDSKGQPDRQRDEDRDPVGQLGRACGAGTEPGGGLAEVTLGGAMQNPGGATQPYSIDVWNADNAAYTV